MPDPGSLLPPTLRRLPFTFSLALTIFVTAAVTGTLTRSITADQLAHWGFGADDLARGHWLQLARSTFQIFDPYMAISMLATVLALVGACEYRLGTPRTVAVYALSHVAGSLAVIAVTKSFAASGNAWGVLLASQEEVGASAGSIGALAAWLMFFPPRARKVLVGLCALFLTAAFAGQVHSWDVAHVVAFAVGLVMGVLMRRRVPRLVGAGIDRRRTMAWIAVIVGLAVVLAPFMVTDVLPLLGTRAHYGERGLDVVRWLFLVSGAMAWVFAPAVRRGERRAWWTLLIVGAVTVIGLWQPGAPGVEYVLAMLLVAGLVWWRADFRERSVTAVCPGGRSAGAWLVAAFVFVLFGFVALRWQFAPPLGWEGSLQTAWSRLRFQPVRTPNWDSAGAHWFLQALPIACYACVAASLLSWLRSGFSRRRDPPEGSSGRSVDSE